MKKTLFWAVSFLFLTGCVLGSVNPFYTPELVVDVPELYGTWFETENGAQDESPIVIAKDKITTYDDKGTPSDAKIVFFKIDDTLFVDIFPDSGQLKKDLVGDGDAVHLLNRVSIDGEKISFNSLDYEWLSKEVEAGRMTLPHQPPANKEDIVFTAASVQWVEFLRAHKDDPKAFPSERESWLSKNPPSKQTP